MEKNFWDRVQELRESINGGVAPMDEIRLPTKTIKFALGMYLVQAGVIAMWWSVRDHAFFPWMLFVSAFLQVGWFWSKVTDSWKYAQYQSLDPEYGHGSYAPPEPIYAPSLNIRTDGVTGHQHSVHVPLNMQAARDSLISTEFDEQ